MSNTLNRGSLKAFINIVNNHKANIVNMTRVNNMDEGLGAYIKDIFANTVNETNKQVKLEKLSKIYSYQGNKR